jgi:hypothetical protein
MRSILREQQYKGEQHPLIYKARDINGDEHTYAMPYTECVEPTEETMLLGDPFFRRSVTYAHVCSRMRTYAHVCRGDYAARRPLFPQVRHVSPRMTRMLTYARTYAHVC